MSTTTNGPAPLTIYDVTIDEFRPATQADIDLMLQRLSHLGPFWLAVESLVQSTAAKVRS